MYDSVCFLPSAEKNESTTTTTTTVLLQSLAAKKKKKKRERAEDAFVALSAPSFFSTYLRETKREKEMVGTKIVVGCRWGMWKEYVTSKNKAQKILAEAAKFALRQGAFIQGHILSTQKF